MENIENIEQGARKDEQERILNKEQGRKNEK